MFTDLLAVNGKNLSVPHQFFHTIIQILHPFLWYFYFYRNSPGSIASTLEANKYKLLMRIPLDDLEVVKGNKNIVFTIYITYSFGYVLLSSYSRWIEFRRVKIE